MIRLIISILLFIILAVFVALNAQHTTTVDVFGYQIEQVSVAAVVTISLAVGVVYSFVLYLVNYLSKSRSARLKNQKQRNKQKAVELAEKARELENTQTPEPLPAPDQEPKKRLFARRGKSAKSGTETDYVTDTVPETEDGS